MPVRPAKPTLAVVRGVLRRHERSVYASGRRLAKHPGRQEVHRHRRNARRLEATAHLLEPFLEPPTYSELRSLTTGLGKGLGKVRDADVLSRRIRQIAHDAHPLLQAELEEFAQDMKHRGKKVRDVRARAAGKRVKAKRLRKPLQDVLAAASAGTADPLRVPTSKLQLRSRRVIASHASPQALHALRLELKAFLYAVEALADARVRGMKSLARQTQTACAILGGFTDGLALADAARDAPPAVRAVLEKTALRQEAEARTAFANAWVEGRWPALARRLDVAREDVEAAFRNPAWPSRGHTAQTR